ncbi:MAG TPA: peptidyl-prolyl cis-trans isomerase [Thermoleophilaceae bacterium]|nr:peptidyl-prolyl cis-trans isomerase [Thermoleophilaceae bacterium]
MPHAHTKLACAAAVLGAAAVAGCGNSVPSGSVAKVGDATITKAEFDKWLGSASQGAAAGGQAAAPDPPEFEKCVAAKQQQPQPQGGPKPTKAQLKKQCRDEYDQLKGDVMQFLIQAEWVQQEAEEQDINVSDQEVRNRLEEEKKRAFPGKDGEKRYQEFLRTSGMSEEDILFRFRLETLQQKLTQKITESEARVTDQDVKDYYDKNKQRFAQPERRDLNVVLTKTKARANQAKGALDDGQSFRQVARRYSIDEGSKSQGGKLPDVAEGQQEKAFNDAIFKARRGDLQGPVKTQFGWYVFEVTRVKPASQQSLEQSEETIKNLLRSQRQQKALDDWIKEFRERYKQQTVCAEDFEVAECDNAPREGTETGPASGGAPQGQPAPGGQPAPQGGAGAPQPVPPPQGGQPPPQQAPPQSP